MPATTSIMIAATSTLLKHLLEDEDDEILDAENMMPDVPRTTLEWIERELPKYGFKETCKGRWGKAIGYKEVEVLSLPWLKAGQVCVSTYYRQGTERWKRLSANQLNPGQETLNYLNEIGFLK